jgi:hypothetical protein
VGMNPEPFTDSQYRYPQSDQAEPFRRPSKKLLRAFSF